VVFWNLQDCGKGIPWRSARAGRSGWTARKNSYYMRGAVYIGAVKVPCW